MEKTEFDVGETFQFGLKTLKVAETPYKNRCSLCFLVDKCHWDDLEDLVGECDGKYRMDGKNIVFEEVEE